MIVPIGLLPSSNPSCTPHLRIIPCRRAHFTDAERDRRKSRINAVEAKRTALPQRRGRQKSCTAPVRTALSARCSCKTVPQAKYVTHRIRMIVRHQYARIDQQVRILCPTVVISASSTSLPYSITHTAKDMRCDIRSLNTHVPSEVSTEADLSFDRSSTFESCGTSRIV